MHGRVVRRILRANSLRRVALRRFKVAASIRSASVGAQKHTSPLELNSLRESQFDVGQNAHTMVVDPQNLDRV